MRSTERTTGTPPTTSVSVMPTKLAVTTTCPAPSSARSWGRRPISRPTAHEPAEQIRWGTGAPNSGRAEPSERISKSRA